MGQVSGDGRWRWDGSHWVPNTAIAPAVGMVPQPGGMVVAPKNPAVSLIVSFFIPGVGSLINGDTTTGVIILVLGIVGIVASFFLIGLPVAIGAWIWGMIDAYQ